MKQKISETKEREQHRTNSRKARQSYTKEKYGTISKRPAKGSEQHNERAANKSGILEEKTQQKKRDLRSETKDHNKREITTKKTNMAMQKM